MSVKKEQPFEEKDKDIILEAEIKADEICAKKDLKENRGNIKDRFYAGSKKMKHRIATKR